MLEQKGAAHAGGSIELDVADVRRRSFLREEEKGDQGAAAISALASLAAGPDVVKQVVDPIGTFYKYSLANSILRRKVQK